MKYYIKRGTKKVYATPNTLMAVQRLAQEEADRLGRAVMIFGDEVGAAVKKVYKRNPAFGRKSKVNKAHNLLVYGDGRRQAAHGGKLRDNPYSKSSHEGELWIKGFKSWAKYLASKR